MSEPILGEIQLFAFDYAPRDWLPCDGRAVPISTYSALNTLLDGRFGRRGGTFNLPNLMDRLPGGAGQGSGRSPRAVGDVYGDTQVQLKLEHLPPHTHRIVSYATREAEGRRGMPTSGDHMSTPTQAFGYNGQPNLLNTTLAPDTLGVTGGNAPRENRQPYQALGFFIATSGDYPQFS